MENQEIKTTWKGLLDHIVRYTKTDREDEIRTWLMAAVFRIWAANKLFSEAYLSVLEVIREQQYSVAQVITALDCAGENGRELKIPLFFRDIVELDKQEGTDNSRLCVDKIGQFLAMAALANGDFTIEEAGVLREICMQLQNYCEEQEVISGRSWVEHPEMITPLREESYYRQMPEEPQSKTYEKPLKPTVEEDVEGEPHAEEYVNPMEGVMVQKPWQEEHSAEGEATLEEVLAELDGLVGLEKVKEDVHSLLNFIKVCQLRRQRGMKVPTISYHLVFTGNPGTGKTTVARLVAKLYYLMGILPQGQLVETDRSGLVAGYLGQTAIKTRQVIQEALGGVLFIDEAYALVNDPEDSYGKEAIETILKAMEDHREELVVIVAGYEELMHRFIDSNPGLRSRFNKYFQFPDYDGKDLLLILKRFCETNGYILAEDAIPFLQEKLDSVFENRKEHFGNARAVRNLFEQAINHQANRLVLHTDISDQDLAELTGEDIFPAMEVM